MSWDVPDPQPLTMSGLGGNFLSGEIFLICSNISPIISISYIPALYAVLCYAWLYTLSLFLLIADVMHSGLVKEMSSF